MRIWFSSPPRSQDIKRKWVSPGSGGHGLGLRSPDSSLKGCAGQATPSCTYARVSQLLQHRFSNACLQHVADQRWHSCQTAFTLTVTPPSLGCHASMSAGSIDFGSQKYHHNRNENRFSTHGSGASGSKFSSSEEVGGKLPTSNSSCRRTRVLL